MKYHTAVSLTHEQLNNGICCSCGKRVKLCRFRGPKQNTLLTTNHKCSSKSKHSSRPSYGRLINDPLLQIKKTRKKCFKRPDKSQRRMYNICRNIKRSFYLKEIEMPTKQEILSTIQPYIDDPSTRAMYDDGACCYHAPDGRKCVIGRMYVNPKQLEKDYEGQSLSIIDQMDEGVELQLIKPYCSWSRNLLYALQELHDNNYNWNEDGLSELGQETLDAIVLKYAKD